MERTRRGVESGGLIEADSPRGGEVFELMETEDATAGAISAIMRCDAVV